MRLEAAIHTIIIIINQYCAVWQYVNRYMGHTGAHGLTETEIDVCSIFCEHSNTKKN